SLEELQHILDIEVTPALQGNLLDIAGEWAGFDDAWVVREIQQGLGKPHTRLVNLDHVWGPVARLVELLRQLPAEERDPRSRAWDALLALFLNKRGGTGTRSCPPHYTSAELERFFRQELWPILIDRVRRLAREHPHLYPTEAE